MVDDQEPRYRLVDADENVVGSLFAESDGTLKLQEGTSGNDNELAFSAEGVLEVAQADVTNETFIRLTRNNQTSSTSSTTLVNGFDSVVRDIRGEASNGQFTPDKDGDYLIAAHPEFAGSATPGDKCAWRLQNVTDSSFVRHDKLQFQLGSPNRPQSGLVAVFPLMAGKTYEIQVTDQTNSFSIDVRSEAVIKSIL